MTLGRTTFRVFLLLSLPTNFHAGYCISKSGPVVAGGIGTQMILPLLHPCRKAIRTASTSALIIAFQMLMATTIIWQGSHGYLFHNH